jgi:hypothetical protein
MLGQKWGGKKLGYARVYFFFYLRLRTRGKLDNEELHDLYSL